MERRAIFLESVNYFKLPHSSAVLRQCNTQFAFELQLQTSSIGHHHSWLHFTNHKIHSWTHIISIDLQVATHIQLSVDSWTAFGRNFVIVSSWTLNDEHILPFIETRRKRIVSMMKIALSSFGIAVKTGFKMLFSHFYSFEM